MRYVFFMHILNKHYFCCHHWSSRQVQRFIRSHLLLDLNTRRAVDVPQHWDGEAPLAIGCRGHRDEGHCVGQGVEDRFVRALFQHWRKDNLLVALSTAGNRREGELLHVWACWLLCYRSKRVQVIKTMPSITNVYEHQLENTEPSFNTKFTCLLKQHTI